MAMKSATQGAHLHPTHAPRGCGVSVLQEETTMRTKRGRHRQQLLVPTTVSVAVITTLCCIQLANGAGGSYLSSTATNRKLRGVDSVVEFTSEESVVDDMCDERPRNLTWWGHDEEWYNECHEHWKRADSQAPTGQWSQTEFAKFVQLQIHASFSDEFKQLPLPLKMIFNELSCRCLEHETSDCCHGPHAKISPGDNVLSWMDSICNRVDTALDEVCRRQQMRARGSEL